MNELNKWWSERWSKCSQQMAGTGMWTHLVLLKSIPLLHMYAVFLLYIESELWPYTSTNLLDRVSDSGSASLVIFNTMKLSVMIVVLSLRTQRLTMALGEYNCWFGYFPCFYHHRVRLHNSLISSCGSSFALHSTRALRRYTFLFFKRLQIILFLDNPCPANLPDIWR